MNFRRKQQRALAEDELRRRRYATGMIRDQVERNRADVVSIGDSVAVVGRDTPLSPKQPARPRGALVREIQQD